MNTENTKDHLAVSTSGAVQAQGPTTLYELDAVYEFRPLPGFFRGEVRRYANGAWLADDGEHDIAFINSWGAPICLMFEPSYQRNIIASWLDGHWTAPERRHPRGNPWHYALRDGATAWGGDWGRERHPNYLAGRKGMDKLCGERSCANGRHVEPTQMDDPHILAGLVRNRETKAVLILPHEPVCMYCGDVWRPA